MPRPVIGITVANTRYDKHSSDSPGPDGFESNVFYADAVARGGGTPILLPQCAARLHDLLDLCDGVIIAGGPDVDPAPFGQPAHEKTAPMPPRRQQFEFALLAALDTRPAMCVLGVCLGLQLMALHHGGAMCQHVADHLDKDRGTLHREMNLHPIRVLADDSVLFRGTDPRALPPVLSAHHQGVTSAGSLRVVATAEDGLIEAADQPARPWYAGVQWHPEAGGDDSLHVELIARFVAAAARHRDTHPTT